MSIEVGLTKDAVCFACPGGGIAHMEIVCRQEYPGDKMFLSLCERHARQLQIRLRSAMFQLKSGYKASKERPLIEVFGDVDT